MRWWLCSATVLTQIRFIWAVRGQDDGRRTCVTLENDIPLFRRKHDEVSINQETNLTFKRVVIATKPRRSFHIHGQEGLSLSAHYERTLDSTFVGVVLL